MSDLQRIKQDLARAKQRAAEIREGKRGVRTGPWLEADGMPGAGLAFSSQLLAQEMAVTRLEFEYLMAMVPNPWSPAAIIEAMEGPVSGQEASQTGDQASRGGSLTSENTGETSAA